MAARDFDLVLFGATSFVGELTAEYLAQHTPAGTRWALAGRSRRKLEALRERLAGRDPEIAAVPLIVADVEDERSVRALARSTRVLLTTVGPYVLYGAPVVAACAEAGTDYVDLTGEPEFVDMTYVRHDATARDTGARLVHCCGFDSVPHDLGAYFAVLQLPEDVPLRVQGYVRASATVSGGTLLSALTGFSRPRANAAAARARRAAEAGHVSTTRRALAVPAPVGGGWAVPLPTIDPKVVVRSARSLDRYGPDFSYSHFAATAHLPTAIGGVAGVAGLVALAQVPAARTLLSKRLAPGQGPSADKRDRSWFSVTFVGEGGGARVVTRVSGGDPGYGETAKMMAECGLSLALDDLPQAAGQVTTATAMGDALLTRLQRAGLRFEVLES